MGVVIKVGPIVFTLFTLLCTQSAFGQQVLRGQIIKAGSSVLDPNQDGFVSKTTSGFSNSRNYWVPEFEISMFSIPKLDGDVTGDNIGKSCGITDIIPDSLGFSVYAVRDASNNLIFRFRVGDNNPSVEAWTILLDTDGLFGANDPNATDENPGFEIDITLIKNQNMGVLVYNIDGIDSCPTPVLTYPLSSHFQISYADEISCADPDYFYDFYVPFPEIANAFGIDVNTGVRLVALTNVSATCAMAGKISDISGVDNNDSQYKDCVTCAFAGLIENQCPTAVVDLCETCSGFAGSSVDAPTIDLPVRSGQTIISGTSEPNIFLIVQVFSRIGGTDQSPVWDTTPREQKSTYANITFWAVTLNNPLVSYDKIVARAQKDEFSVPCGVNGGNVASTSVTVVQPNTQPIAQDQTTDVTEDVPKSIVLTGSDAEGDPLTYLVVNNPANGTLSGTGSNITYTPNLNFVGADGFTFTVSDGILASDLGTVTINVTPVNDAPVLTGSTTPRTFTASPLLIDNTISLTDVDDIQMEGALISITSNFQPAEDVLQFTNQNGITGSYNAANGVLTLTGTSSNANYITALRSITYNNIDATPSTATRQVSFFVNDGTANSNTHIGSIVVIDVNDPPIIVDDNNNGIDTVFYTINEDEKLDTCINVLDPDGDLVVIETIVNLTGNGSDPTFSGICFSYMPNSDFFGEERLRIIVTDSRNPAAGTDTALVVITIIPVNDPPTLTGATTPRSASNAPIVIDNTMSITDVDDTQMESAVISITTNFKPAEDVLNFTNQNGITGSYNATSGVLTLSGTSSTANYITALRTITYHNTDATPSTVTRQVSVVVNDGTANSNTHIHSIEVIDVNDPPIIVDDNNNGIDTLLFTINEDQALDTCINALDPDSDFVVINSIVNLTGNGSSPTFSGLCFSYLPNANYFGEERLQIIISDQRNPAAGTDTALVIISILPINDPPELSGTSTPVSYTNTPVIVDNTIDLTDIDDTQMENALVSISGNFQASEDELQFTNQNGISGSYNSTNGILTLTGTSSIANYIDAFRSITYNNIAAFPNTVTRQVSFSVNDGQQNSNVYSKSITLSNVNNPPLIVDNNGVDAETLFYTINEDEALAACINVFDLDGDVVVIDTLINLTQAGFNVSPISFSGRCFTYTPYRNFNSSDFGDEQLSVIVSDLRNPVAGTDTALLVITVLSVNDPPNIGGSATPITFTNSPLVIDDLVAVGDDDFDNTGGPMSSAVISIRSNFQPAEDALQFTNQNGITGSYNPATGVLTLSGITSMQNYSTALSSITYSNTNATPNTVTRQVSFVVNDGTDNSNTHIRSIVVVDVNNPPIIVDNNNNGIDTLRYTINEDQQLNACINAIDFDGDLVAIETISNLTGNGSDPEFSDLCFNYIPDNNYFGEERLRIIVTDLRNPDAGRDTALAIITILEVNDPPVLTGAATPQNASNVPVIIDNTIAITDVDDSQMESAVISISSNFYPAEDALQFTNENGITGSYNATTGILTLTGAAPISNYIDALASISYTNTDATPSTATRQVSFVVNDGTDNSNTHIRSIVVIDVNDPPIIVDNNNIGIDTLIYTLDEDQRLDTCINALDLDGDLVVIDTLVNMTGNGSLTYSGLCFSYTPIENYSGEERLQIVITDQRNPGAGTDTALVIIHIEPINDPPVVGDTSITINENETVAICLDAKITDVENDPIEFISGISDHGTSVSSSNDICFTRFSYTPDINFIGVDLVKIRVCDANDNTLCDTATVTITVLRLNDAPVISKPIPELYMYEDSVSEVNLVCLQVTDDSPSLTFDPPIKLSGEGIMFPSDTILAECFIYQSPLNWYGDTTWELKVCDNENPSLCDTVKAIIHVLPVNDPPLAARDTLFADNDKVSSINVLLNDSDPVENDGLELTTIPISGPFNALSFSMEPDGTINYRPNRGYNGIDSLVYQVCDTGTPSMCDTSVVVFYVLYPPFKIYQAVSPNGDGLNDYWRINGIEDYPDNLVRVFDRFNNMVFEISGYSNESNFWSGQSNHGLSHNNLPEGTYFYSIILGDGSGPLSGYVILKRQ